MDTATPFKWRHFQAEIILLCVRRYLRYPLSYRDLEDMMLERGLNVDHTTIYRWLQHYAPELEKRCRPHLKATNDSWRRQATSPHPNNILLDPPPPPHTHPSPPSFLLTPPH